MGLGGGGNNPPSVSELDERLYRRGVGYRGRLGGQGAWQSEGERSDSEADGREDAQGGAALEVDDLDALVEQALKSSDSTFCSQVAKVANDLDPDRWGPATVADVSVSGSGWGVGNPLHDALRDGRETFDVPLLSLTNFQSHGVAMSLLNYPTVSSVKHWRADLPVCQVRGLGAYSGLFCYYNDLRTAEFSCPLLEDGRWMFCRDANLESVKLHAPMLKNGSGMFLYCTGLSSFEGDLSSLENGEQFTYPSWSAFLVSFKADLPSLTNGNQMFCAAKLDLPSVQRVARTIKDNSAMDKPPNFYLGMDKALKGQVDSELALIRSKGWTLTTKYT